jgi:hypothetical protein
MTRTARLATTLTALVAAALAAAATGTALDTSHAYAGCAHVAGSTVCGVAALDHGAFVTLP